MTPEQEKSTSPISLSSTHTLTAEGLRAEYFERMALCRAMVWLFKMPVLPVRYTWCSDTEIDARPFRTVNGKRLAGF